MTRTKTLQCVHEPFGDAYYFGPERLAERYESDPEARKSSGYAESTYRTIFDRIARENSEVRSRHFFELSYFHACFINLISLWSPISNDILLCGIVPIFYRATFYRATFYSINFFCTQILHHSLHDMICTNARSQI